MSKKEKTYDAVKMMREIREKISAETRDMSYEEFRSYIEKRLIDKRLKTIE
ncbi:MAG TPA: hypothetical protein VGI43_12290 [Mucilaginibacter sp.]